MVSPNKRAAPNRTGPSPYPGERPVAYEPPEADEQEFIVEWEPPSFTEMMKELGLRCFEVGMGAAAEAIGHEVAYFFGSRRLFTREQRNRRDYR